MLGLNSPGREDGDRDLRVRHVLRAGRASGPIAAAIAVSLERVQDEGACAIACARSRCPWAASACEPT